MLFQKRAWRLGLLILVGFGISNASEAGPDPKVFTYLGADGLPHSLSTDASLETMKREAGKMWQFVYDYWNNVNLPRHVVENVHTDILVPGIHQPINDIYALQQAMSHTTAAHEDLWILNRERTRLSQPGYQEVPVERDLRERALARLNRQIEYAETTAKRKQKTENSVYMYWVLDQKANLSTIQGEIKSLEAKIEENDRFVEAHEKQQRFDLQAPFLRNQIILGKRKSELEALEARIAELPRRIEETAERVHEKLKTLGDPRCPISALTEPAK